MEETERQGTARITQVFVVLAATFVALLGLRELQGIVAPLLLTVNLFIAAYPIQTWLTQRKVPGPLAQLVLAIVMLFILGLFFYALTWSAIALVQELPAYQGKFTELYHESIKLLASWGLSEEQMLNQLKTINPTNLAGVIQNAIGSVTNFITVLVVIITMIVMMVIDAGTFPARDQALRKHQHLVWLSVADFTGGVRRYWVVTTVFGLIVAAIDVTALVWMGIPLAFVWGVLSFLTNYIPNVGFIIGVIPPALMALLDKGPLEAVIVIAIYSVANFVIQSIIQPKFNGDAVGVTATVSFLSLLLWSYVLGGLGALLALPMTLLLKSLFIDHDPKVRWMNAIISNAPETSDPAGADDLQTPPTPPQIIGPRKQRRRARPTRQSAQSNKR